MVKPETIAAAGPGEDGERHRASSHCSCRMPEGISGSSRTPGVFHPLLRLKNLPDQL